MLFKEFYSEIESSMQQYKSAGLLDELSVYNMVLDGFKELSIIPTIRIQTVLYVQNNKTKLPDGFKSLYSAVKCDPFVFTPEKEEPKDILMDIYTYKVREIKKENWNICNPCDVREEETCVVEKTYFHDGRKGNFYYNNITPIKLKLTPYVKKNQCDADCKNFNIKESPYEISINNKILYTNFKQGNIFITYNGYEEDDEGFVIIPETEEGNIEKFLKAYVQKEIIKKMFLNSDNTTNEQMLYQIYSAESELYKARSIGEYKMKRVLHSLRHRYPQYIKKEFSIFGSKTNSNYNRIEFLVT